MADDFDNVTEECFTSTKSYYGIFLVLIDNIGTKAIAI